MNDGIAATLYFDHAQLPPFCQMEATLATRGTEKLLKTVSNSSPASVGLTQDPERDSAECVDCIYVAAFRGDSRLTRICVASIRYFYPDIPLRVLAGSPLKGGLVRELASRWNTSVADLPVGDYGSGFVKLEPLFGPRGEKFLMLDADTIVAGPILDVWRDSGADFLVDQEEQTESDTKSLYYDWDGLKAVDSRTQQPLFVYNSGQWFGTAGLFSRDDFSPWVEWSMPRRLKHRKLFMQGDQGVLNYLFNQKVREGSIRVDRKPIMYWPVRSMANVNLHTVANRTGPPVVVHWAGLKKKTLRSMPHSELLDFFERYYYAKFRCGKSRRIYDAFNDVFAQLVHEAGVKIRHTLQKIHAVK